LDIPRKYGARFDDLDWFRNGDLGLYEHVDVKKLRHHERLTTNSHNHLGEGGAGPFFSPLTGEMETWVVTNRDAHFDTGMWPDQSKMNSDNDWKIFNY